MDSLYTLILTQSPPPQLRIVFHDSALHGGGGSRRGSLGGGALSEYRSHIPPSDSGYCALYNVIFCIRVFSLNNSFGAGRTRLVLLSIVHYIIYVFHDSNPKSESFEGEHGAHI